MNWRRCILLGLVTAGWLSGRSLSAAVAPGENPYLPIVERNVFALVPIPTNVPVDPATLIPPPKITPNGIMTLFGKLQVLFKVASNKPGQPPKEDSYVMSEGDRQDDVEVQKIDERAAVITFNNHGVVQELPLVATASGGAPPPAPGYAPPPNVAPSVAPAGGNGAIGFGGRFGRGRGVTTGGNPNAGGGAGNGASPVAASQPTEPVPPLEQQVIMIEANRLQALQDNDPMAKILPPTELTSQVTGNPADEIPEVPPGQ